MLTAADYRPPTWLRDPHLQSLLGSSRLRRRRAQRRFLACGAITREYLLDGGDGVRLQGFHSALPPPAHGLVVLFHGWEGSAESGYMLAAAAALLEAGFEVFRLNFRDHGDTHHLNEELFHSCRLDEVVNAVGDLARRVATRPLLAAGYSLGGNFALRLARETPRAGIPLAYAAAVCPPLRPAGELDNFERSLWLYHWYYMRKWRRSLRVKRALFPQRHTYDERRLRQGMRGLTADLVVSAGGFADLAAYLDGYAVAGERLSALQVPVSLITSADDPVIPVHEYRTLVLPAHSSVEITPWGGHCGFIEDASLRSFAERWVVSRMLAAVGAPVRVEGKAAGAEAGTTENTEGAEDAARVGSR